MPESRPALDDADFMRALLDFVIPANGEVPGAGSLGLSPFVAEGLREDRMLAPLVEPGLQAMRDAALGQHPEGLPGMTAEAAKAFVAEQLSANPVLVMGLLRHVCPAYYAQPQVLEAIGEEPRPPFPQGYEVEPTDPELMEKLRARQRPGPE